MNRVVIITGATSGFGLATAKKFKQSGDRVVIVSRNAEKVENTVKEFGFDSGFCLDVTNAEGWQELYSFVAEKYGRVDVLVNNAGGGVCVAEAADQSYENIDKGIALNLNSVIYGSKTFADMMKKQGGGTIINFSSVCGRHCWSGWSVYAAAKAGVLSFSKSLYVELRPYGVRVTCIMPAASGTDFQKNAGIPDENQTLSAEDIASAVLYAADLPQGAVVEEMTVWGMSQTVNQL